MQDYIPTYLNFIISEVEASFFGRIEAGGKEKFGPLKFLPVHNKFLGDGMLCIWTENEFPAGFITALCNRLWNTKNSFGAINRAAAEVVPVAELPKKICFGLARGTVYKLSTTGTQNKE